MDVLSIIEKQSKIVADFFQEELKKELEAQGHRDTGSLIDSINYEILIDSQEVNIVFSYLFYGDIVNDGVPAANIPFTPPSGRGGTSKYIEALKNWASRRGFKKPLSAAFAIAAKHKKEGMPTKNSYKFSSNGRRKYWRAFTLETYLPQSLEIFASADLNELIGIILRQGED